MSYYNTITGRYQYVLFVSFDALLGKFQLTYKKVYYIIKLTNKVTKWLLEGGIIMYKIGIVGAGIIAKSHSDAIQTNGECTVVAVADIVRESAEKIAEPYGAKVFTDYHEMCDNCDLDIVILNLPHYLHCEATCFFLSHGIHVYVEKPMAMNVKECDIMIETANKNNVCLAVGHVQQYTSAHKYLKNCIKTNEYGKLLRVTETRNVNYFLNRPKWFVDKELSGGGIVMNYGAHTLDKLLYITDSTVENAVSVCRNTMNDCTIEEGAQALVKLKNGVSATLSYTGSEISPEYETMYYFEKERIRVTSSNQLYMWENGGWELKISDESYAVMYDSAIEELVKFIKGEPSEITTAQHGKAVMEGIEMIYNNSL